MLRERQAYIVRPESLFLKAFDDITLLYQLFFFSYVIDECIELF